MSDKLTRPMIGTVVQWQTGHGTGVVYTGVVAPIVPYAVDHLGLADTDTLVRVTLVEVFPTVNPTLPDLDSGRITLDQSSAGQVRPVRTAWLHVVPAHL
jgi:hypothetical protein